MTKEQFYRGKTVVRTEWWLESSGLPTTILWARQRVFGDRSSDVRFEGESRVFGFEGEEHANYFLGEDEFVRFSRLDSDDEESYGVPVKVLMPPIWTDEPELFEYIGRY